MVKIIRDFVPRPTLAVYCDCSCGQFLAGQFEPATPEQAALGQAEQIEQAAMKSFVTLAMQQGWKIDLDRQLCPQHVKKEAGETSRILIPVGRFSPLNQ